jgi:diacylglycerol kinase (ATP)
VVFLNIFHWGGGVTNLWKETVQNKKFLKQSLSDGKIEVIGLSDAIHMGQVQVGLDEAFQLAQAKVIEIIASKPNQVVPMQIDGEPMELISPFKIRIERKDQVEILATTGSMNSKISKLLREGLKEQIITEEQMVQLSQLAAKVA